MTDTARASSEAAVTELVLYSRPGCHLCDDAREMALALLRRRADQGLPSPALVERDITTNPEWERAFHTTIPVFELRGRRLELATSPAGIQALIEAGT